MTTGPSLSFCPVSDRKEKDIRGIDLAAASVVDRLAVVTAADQDAYYELDDLEEEVLVFLVAAVAEGSVYNPVEALAVRLPFFSCALEVETGGHDTKIESQHSLVL